MFGLGYYRGENGCMFGEVYRYRRENENDRVKIEIILKI